jgi:hypothetical protein
MLFMCAIELFFVITSTDSGLLGKAEKKIKKGTAITLWL